MIGIIVTGHAYLQIDCGKDQDVLPGKIAREYRALKIAAHLLRDLGNRRIDEVMIKVVLILVQAGFLEVIMQELRAVIDVSRCLYLLAVPGDEQIGTAILDQKLPDRGDIMGCQRIRRWQPSSSRITLMR